MTVKKLILILQKMEPDRQVVIAKDAEGNDFSPLERVVRAVYLPESTYSGTVRNTAKLPAFNEGIAAVILEPIN